jgi:hypothetical protein
LYLGCFVDGCTRLSVGLLPGNAHDIEAHATCSCKSFICYYIFHCFLVLGSLWFAGGVRHHEQQPTSNNNHNNHNNTTTHAAKAEELNIQ